MNGRLDRDNDLWGLSRREALEVLVDAALASHARPSAPFYSPSQLRDEAGRWTTGGGGRTAAEHAAGRESALGAVRDYLAGKREFPTATERETLAGHLSRLTVAQLHAVKAEHGLKGSAPNKAGLVAKLAERFLAHREGKTRESVSTPVDKGAGGGHNTPVGKDKPTGEKAVKITRDIGSWIGDPADPSGGRVDVTSGTHDIGHELPEGTVTAVRVNRRAGTVTYTVTPRTAAREAEYLRKQEVAGHEHALAHESDVMGDEERLRRLRRLAELEPVRYAGRAHSYGAELEARAARGAAVAANNGLPFPADAAPAGGAEKIQAAHAVREAERVAGLPAFLKSFSPAQRAARAAVEAAVRAAATRTDLHRAVAGYRHALSGAARA